MTAETPPRTFRVEDELWKPFLQLVPQTEQADASTVLRRWIADYEQRYGVFWAQAASNSPEMAAFYDCEECDEPHRLDGTDAPWGCSVVKAYTDRQAKAMREAAAAAIQMHREATGG